MGRLVVNNAMTVNGDLAESVTLLKDRHDGTLIVSGAYRPAPDQQVSR
jgi:hypothetical protein